MNQSTQNSGAPLCLPLLPIKTPLGIQTHSLKLAAEQCPYPPPSIRHSQEGDGLEPERAPQGRCLLRQRTKSGQRAFIHRGSVSPGVQGPMDFPGLCPRRCGQTLALTALGPSPDLTTTQGAGLRGTRVQGRPVGVLWPLLHERR